LLLMKNF